MRYSTNSPEQEASLDTDRLLAKTMRFLSVGLPVIVSIAAIANAILYAFAKNILGVEGLCLVVSALIARYFYRRSRNKEAVIYTARVLPSGDMFEPDPVDHVVLILAGVLIAMSAFPSLLELFA